MPSRQNLGKDKQTQNTTNFQVLWRIISSSSYEPFSDQSVALPRSCFQFWNQVITRFTKPQRVQRVQDYKQRSFRILQLFICSPAGRGGEEASAHLPSPQDKLRSLAAGSPLGLLLPPTAGVWDGTAPPSPPFAEQQNRWRDADGSEGCFPMGQKWSCFAFCRQDTSHISSQAAVGWHHPHDQPV